MTKPLTLTAAAAPAGTIAARLSSDSVTASVAERTISGVICEYGAIGYTSWGRTIFERGGITIPTPTTKVKLLLQHDTYSAAVGIMSSFADDASKPRAAFTVPQGDEGDDALVKAANGLRDGLSVGVTPTQWYFDEDDVVHIVQSSLYEVSLVTIPAFENAGVTSVAAAHQEGNTMNREQLNAALAAGQITQQEFDRQVALLDAAAAAATPPPAPAAAAPAAPASVPAPVQAANVPDDLSAERQAPPAAPVTAGNDGMGMRELAQRTIEHIRANGVNGLTAALEDTIPGNDTGKAFLGNKKWKDELWQVGKLRRPLIDTFGTEQLTEDGLEGWVWDPTKVPTVPAYSGDKSDVHSEELGWIPKSVSPTRFAGGWDIDRKFVDLGRTGMIQKAYEKAVEDYKRQTEAAVRTAVIAGATNVSTAKADLITLLIDLGSLALGGTTGQTAFDLDFVHLAPALYSEFINLDEDSVPWWLKAQGKIDLGQSSGEAGGIKFVSNPGLATRQWLAGDSNAVTIAEFDPPVKVTAENIPQGGIDLGVFGYLAVLVNDARGLYKGTVTAPTP